MKDFKDRREEGFRRDPVIPDENRLEGRNAVLEAFRAGRTIDKLFVLDGCQDGPVKSILREARKQETVINFLSRDRLDQMSQTG